MLQLNTLYPICLSVFNFMVPYPVKKVNRKNETKPSTDPISASEPLNEIYELAYLPVC